MLTAILRDDPAPVETAPAELTRIARRALEKNREKRYQSASEIERDLATYIESLSVPHSTATRPGGWLNAASSDSSADRDCSARGDDYLASTAWRARSLGQGASYPTDRPVCG